MTIVQKFFISVALVSVSASFVMGQAVQPAASESYCGVYATISGGATGEREDHALGGSLGGFCQGSGLLGLEVRADALRVKATYPQFALTGGLRASKTLSHLSPYVFGGIGVARFQLPVILKTVVKTYVRVGPPQYNMDAEGAIGCDYRFGRVTWRMADLSAKRIRDADGAWPWTLSTGIRITFHK